MATEFSVTSLNNNTNTLATTLSGSDNLLANSTLLSTSSSNSLLGSLLSGSSSSNLGSRALSGNIIVGDNKSVIPGNNPQLFATQARNALDKFVSVIFDRLNDKFVAEGGDKKTYSVANENPFANGNNPFGEGNLPELPALDFLKSQYGENFPLPSQDALNGLQGNSSNDVNNLPGGNTSSGESVNPITDSGNASGGSSNIFLSGNSPTTDSDGVNLIAANVGNLNSETSSDNLETGGSNAVANGGASSNPITGGGNAVTDGGSSNSITGGGSNPFAGGGSNPFAGGGSNPFAGGGSNPFAGGGSNPFAGGGSNPFAGGGSNPFAGGGSNPFTGSGSGNPVTGGASGSPITGSGSDNPFAGASLTDTLSGTLNYVLDLRESFRNMGSNSLFGGDGGNESPLKSPSDLLRLFRSDMASFGLTVESFTNLVGDNNPFAGSDNPFAGTNPFASNDDQTSIEKLDGRLFKFLGWALDGLLPFTGTPNVFQTPEGELPLGYGNRDFGSGNAVIGNANRDYGSNNASIGNNNWNWDNATGNATIGNENWNFSSNNKTVGNGNFNLDYSSGSNTFGNGNWNIGSDNSTLGNGNFNFGNNNLVIGNGNWVFTSNSIVIGNGNWSVILDNTPANQITVSSILEKINNLALGAEIKSVVDDLVSSTVQKMGSVFYGLTDDFNESQKQTFDKVIRNKDAYSLQNPFAYLAST